MLSKGVLKRMPWIAKAAEDDEDDTDAPEHPGMVQAAVSGFSLAIQALVALLMRRVRRRFIVTVEVLSQRVDVEQIETLLKEGRVAEAIDSVRAEMVQDAVKPIAIEVSDATVAAAKAEAADRISPQAVRSEALRGIDFSFGAMNPTIAATMHTYEMDKIRELSTEALAAVRTTIAQGVQDGRSPVDVARDVRAHIGLTARQAQAVMNYRRALEAGDKAALERGLRDKRFDSSVARAIRDDKPLGKDKIDKMVERYRARYLKYRAETISRTEAIRAVNQGAVLAWRQQIDAGKIGADEVVKRWIYTPDSRTRHAHRTIPSMNKGGVGIDEAFQSELGPIRYPGDPQASAANVVNCRCAMVIRYVPR